jgi:predicted phage-related endonuclease
MTLHVYELEQRSDEWYEARRGLITASIMGQLVTPATLRTANNDKSRAIHAELAAERITGWSDNTYTSWDMQRGIDDEPIARDYYARHHAPVTQVGFMVREFDGFKCGYSPDGLVGDDGLIEVKCPRAKSAIPAVIADEAPAEYMAQLQAALLVSGREWVDFIPFVGGLPFYVKRVYADPEWQHVITEAVTAAETAIAAIVTDYARATKGLPATERTIREVLI